LPISFPKTFVAFRLIIGSSSLRNLRALCVLR
jgi:hypothetical protein